MILAVTIGAAALSTAHRPRASVSSRGRLVVRKADGYRQWCQRVHLELLRARPKDWPLDARYLVRLVVWEPTAHHRDLDNLVKGILDGATGVLWADDWQVDMSEQIRGDVDRDRPRVSLLVRTLDVGEAARHARLCEAGHAACEVA